MPYRTCRDLENRTRPIGRKLLHTPLVSLCRGEGNRAADKSPCASTQKPPAVGLAAQPDPTPPPLHTAAYSGRQMSGWRPRPAQNIVLLASVLVLRPSAAGVGSGCTKWQPRSGRQSRPSRGPLRRRRRGARARGARLFGHVTIVLASLRAIERVRSRTRTTSVAAEGRPERQSRTEGDAERVGARRRCI